MIGMRLPRPPTIVLNTVLLALALAGSGWAYHVVTASDTMPQQAASQLNRTVAATQGTVSATASASGTIASATTASATFVTSATLIEVAVAVADVVVKGQILGKVDPTAAKATLTTAQANLTAAQLALTKVTASTTADDTAISSAQDQVTQAQTAVTTAQRAVDGTVLTAPIAGTVTAVNGTVGSAPSSGFIQLADLTSLQVTASFAETDAVKLKVRQTATVHWSALSGTTATATVATLAPTATATNNVNTYAVVAKIDAAPAGARIGQSATVKVTTAEAANVIRVPVAALHTTGGQNTVQVVATAGTETRTVTVGVIGDQYIEITAGLAAGDQVLISTKSSTNSSANSNSNQQGTMMGGDGAPPAGGPGGGP
jgi:membrane fusion protein, macrolide-specific efflux system